MFHAHAADSDARSCRAGTLPGRARRDRASPYSQDMGNVGRRRRVLVLVALVLGVAAVALGARLTENHGYGWEWTLTPSAAPPKIHFEGRDYDRGGEQSDAVPSRYVLEGKTPGGGEIYKSGLDEGTSTVILVKDGEHVYAYGLMGGP